MSWQLIISCNWLWGVQCLVCVVPGTDSTGRIGYGCPGRGGLDGATPRRAQRPSRRSRLPMCILGEPYNYRGTEAI